MATSEMRRLAESGWWAMSGPKAIGLWHSSSTKSFFRIGTQRQLCLLAKSVGLTQPSIEGEAVYANGQVSLHDMLP